METKYTNYLLPSLRTGGRTLLDRHDRLRKTALVIGLSKEAKGRLEWFIFHEVRAQGNARLTARHFGIAPKTFYKWHKRFDNGLVGKLEDESKAPINTRQWTVTIEEQTRIKKLRIDNIHYGKKKLMLPHVLLRKQVHEN